MQMRLSQASRFKVLRAQACTWLGPYNSRHRSTGIVLSCFCVPAFRDRLPSTFFVITLMSLFLNLTRHIVVDLAVSDALTVEPAFTIACRRARPDDREAPQANLLWSIQSCSVGRWFVSRGCSGRVGSQICAGTTVAARSGIVKRAIPLTLWC